MDVGSTHKHIQAHAEEAGYPRLKTVTKPWLQKYLKKTEIKPFKIKYYLEREDSESSYRTTGIWHILFRMMKTPAFRLLSTNTPTIIQQRKTVISVEIMSMCGLERCLCLQELIFWRGMQFRWSARHTKVLILLSFKKCSVQNIQKVT